LTRNDPHRSDEQSSLFKYQKTIFKRITFIEKCENKSEMGSNVHFGQLRRNNAFGQSYVIFVTIRNSVCNLGSACGRPFSSLCNPVAMTRNLVTWPFVEKRNVKTMKRAMEKNNDHKCHFGEDNVQTCV